MFHNWSHPQTFCKHQTVPKTQPTTNSEYYNAVFSPGFKQLVVYV